MEIKSIQLNGVNVTCTPSNDSSRVKHIPTGQTGAMIDIYKPTGKPTTLKMRCDDGEIYFAPLSEFIEI